MTNYKVVASGLTDTELDEGIKRTRKLLKHYQQMTDHESGKYEHMSDYVDQLDARLTAFMIEQWNRKYPSKSLTK